MNNSRAIQNIPEADYRHQYLHANAMFHSTDDAFSSIRLVGNAKAKILSRLFLDLKWRLHIRPLNAGFAIGSPSVPRTAYASDHIKTLGLSPPCSDTTIQKPEFWSQCGRNT